MRAGDVLTVDFGSPMGSEPGFLRPAVVVTAGLVLEGGPHTIHVVPVTSNVALGWDSDVPVDDPGLEAPSVAQCHLVGVIALERVVESDRGNVGPSALRAMREVIADLLGID